MTKILLVEDDKSLREIYGVRLLAEGYDIVSAGDGEEALAMAIKDRPDLIVSDVMMPKISGFDMLDILRSTTETKNIKVIMMTALSSEEQRQRGVTLGADRYLVKSQVGIEDVVRTVHEVLADAPIAGQAPLVSTSSAPAPSMPMAAPAATPAPVPTPMQAPAMPPMPAPSVPPRASTPIMAGPGVVADPAPAAPTVPPRPSAPAPAPAPAPAQTPAMPAPTPTMPAAEPAPMPSAPAQAPMTPATAAPSTPTPVAPPAPLTGPVSPAPAPAPLPTSTLPQPTAPFSTPRNTNLAARVIQPLESNAPAGPDLGNLMNQELGNAPSGAMGSDNGLNFEETPRPMGAPAQAPAPSMNDLPPVPPAPNTGL